MWTWKTRCFKMSPLWGTDSDTHWRLSLLEPCIDENRVMVLEVIRLIREAKRNEDKAEEKRLSQLARGLNRTYASLISAGFLLAKWNRAAV